MFGHNFYHSLIKKYVALFGTLFNDVFIERDGVRVKVPIAYGPREKVLDRITADPNFDRPAILLPRMSFEITDIRYAQDRKLNTINRNAYVNDGTYLTHVYNPVPYDISFDLSIMVKYTEDGTKIVEQILPFFTPEWTATVELISEPSIAKDIPVILKNVRTEDSYEGSYEERRAIIWTLSFELKGYLFGPIKKAKQIKFATINMYTDTTANTAEATMVIRPGLTGDGEPTTNVNSSIALADIYPDDNFGYIVTITDA